MTGSDRRRPIAAALVAAVLMASTLMAHAAAAQTVRPPIPQAPLPPLDDYAVHAALTTPPDTARLLLFAVPAALDSLRQHDADAHPVRLSLPQLHGPDTAWAAQLVDGRFVRGICRPIRRHCRGNDVLELLLTAAPLAGDEEVRLVLRHARLKPPSPTILMDDEMRRFLEMRAVGIPSTGSLLWPRDYMMLAVDDDYLVLTPAGQGWRIVRWHSAPVSNGGP